MSTGTSDDRVIQTPKYLSRTMAFFLVVWVSFVVLVSEIVATRMVAPYVGVTLESLSAVIGCVLAGISLGNWIGGWLADRLRPATLLGPSLLSGGLLLALAPRIVRAVGPDVAGSDPWGALILSLAAFFLPSVLLSTVGPIVIKALGERSTRLGSVAGGVYALGTAGALLGNFSAGFYLMGTLRTSQILILGGIGSVILGGLLTALHLRSRKATAMAALVLLLAVAVPLVDSRLPCRAETEYVCLNIDKQGTGYLIRSNIYSSSYTDVARPSSLFFPYTRDVAAAVQAAFTEGEPNSFLYIGGGGYTLPLYFRTLYPGSRQEVLEIDRIMVDEVLKVLAPERALPGITTAVGDARVEIADVGKGVFDVVVGDAFSGISVPWHLTTREFLHAVRESMTPRGIYVMNLIDYDSYELARAEVRTFFTVFPEVAVLASPGVFSGSSSAGANIILLGGSRLPDESALSSAATASRTGSAAISGDAARAFARGRPVLTDAFAPVDQLLGRP